MTDHKYTDDEVIRACECCASSELSCIECPAGDTPLCGMSDKLLLEIVQRQRAEIERLKKDNEYILMQHKFQRRPSGDCWNDVIEKAKSEAAKEFAEMAKARAYQSTDWSRGVHPMVVEVDDIDELVEEIAGGGQNGNNKST